MKIISVLLVLMMCASIGCIYTREGALLERDERVNQELLSTKYKDMDPQKKEMILKRKYEIGFAKEEVKMAQGSFWRPSKILKGNGDRFDEVWIYKTSMCGANEIFLYFKDDILVQREMKEHVCKNLWDKLRSFFF